MLQIAKPKKRMPLRRFGTDMMRTGTRVAAERNATNAAIRNAMRVIGMNESPSIHSAGLPTKATTRIAV